MTQSGAVAGFVLAAHTCGDASGERALRALAPALRAPLSAALAEAAAEDTSGRHRLLARASRALDPDPPEGSVPIREPAPSEPRGLARALRRLADPDPSEAELRLLAEGSWPE